MFNTIYWVVEYAAFFFKLNFSLWHIFRVTHTVIVVTCWCLFNPVSGPVSETSSETVKVKQHVTLIIISPAVYLSAGSPGEGGCHVKTLLFAAVTDWLTRCHCSEWVAAEESEGSAGWADFEQRKREVEPKNERYCLTILRRLLYSNVKVPSV